MVSRGAIAWKVNWKEGSIYIAAGKLSSMLA